MADSNILEKRVEDKDIKTSRKKKPKSVKEDPWRPDGGRDPFAMLDALPEEKQQEIQRALHLFSLGGRLPKTLEEASKHSYRFWDTQPVPKLTEDVTSHGPIEEDKTIFRVEPFSLPKGFLWDSLALSRPAVMKELCKFLNSNYMENDDNTLSCDFSPEYLSWALCPPGWQPQWHCGVRGNTNQKLVGFVAAVPSNIRTYDTEKKMVQVNFLCVHKKLRAKRMSPVLIREITRRVHLQGIYQAVYTTSVVLPKPVVTCRYWHRSLNPRKLMDLDLSSQGKNMTLQCSLKLLCLPEATKSVGLRPMMRHDIAGVHTMLQKHLTQAHLAPILSLEEVEHWLLPRETVIDTYVVEGSDGALTDLVSFYTVTSRVMNHPVHSFLRVAHCFYCVSTNTVLPELIEDTLVLAKAKEFDLFTTLDVMDNSSFLEKLKFHRGDRNLHYYLYNWKCPSTYPHKMGLVIT
ncbi:glycylpeptide N-tetradecanoyltransferase 1-like isoform X1 [Hypomesus transpacificus]|uniref:glycylpeptide N-tetradecanoyltransferase 1-like isoform X1 n=1 Tax=Hypomesus transpacificus TaxID=137520 RepID=UPI001F080F53|nr:glycylpeptide N-tetradecanoyltransferase 1-like isoform X1 [Hypomesus transpacificus]